MALILHIETASPVCSVALSRDGRLLASVQSSEDRSHATRLTILIRELLHGQDLVADDLDAISLGMGPGSYTGLRIGASVAKGLAYGSGKPVIGIPTLKALAHGFSLSHPAELEDSGDKKVLLCPMLDARRMEVYSAFYSNVLEEVAPVEAVVLDPQSFDKLLDDHVICFFGTGSDKFAEIIHHPNARFFSGIELSAEYQAEPAETLYRLGEFLDTAYFEPHYLKEFIASIPKNKVLGSAG